MATPPPEPLSPEKKGDEEARGLLYEAYNELQRLAAELGGAAVPAPAVVVVGHQTDGKSALVEALMGFQFNHVGGGTKTRRPIALHLRFNPSCHSPNCRLLAGSGEGDAEDDAGAADRAMPLADIQVRSSMRTCGSGIRTCLLAYVLSILVAPLQCTVNVCVIASVMNLIHFM
jgi:hypothetical protein